jgi:hypothetical protein
MNAGRIDACLIGTLAKATGADVDDMVPDWNSYAEMWFMQISPGHTPENHVPSRMAMEWITEFQSLVG